MIPITQDFLPINKFSRTGARLKAKKGIVMHYTASPGAPAKNISKYFASLSQQNPNDSITDRYAGAHYSVDRTSIYCSIPDNELAYHCGSKTYTKEALAKLGSYPNNCTVSIEMCIEKDGSIHEETFIHAVDLVAYLIKERDFPNSIWTHKEIVGWKDCPLPWIKKPDEFERFKQAVALKLNPVNSTIPQKPAEEVKEEDEVNKVLEYEKWAWTELEQYIGNALKEKLITDETWVAKVRDKKLTYSELILLKVLIDERRRKRV